MPMRMRPLAAAMALIVLVAAGLAGPAAARTSFRPRIGRAFGLMPPAGTPDIAVGQPYPEVYNGGPVMRNVTVHSVFWAPSGFSFDGSPGPGVLGYVPMIQQFLTDVAHDSGSTHNVFSVLNQYGDSHGPGSYRISYSAGADTVIDTHPYPVRSHQCASPSGLPTCLTDLEISNELDRVIAAHDPSGRGLHDVWEVFLPPNVDECLSAGACGSNAFAGYHSFADAGHGPFIYAVMIDTLIEEPPILGADPQGNAEAESVIDTAAHETVESITDPEGVGWIDPNGNEVGDKCETGLQQGTPLGYAPDGAPYNQLINGHEYDIQTMWSNTAGGCEQSSTTSVDHLPLPSVHLTQFSPRVSGSAGVARRGVRVRLALLRAQTVVATASATTRRNGRWGPVTLHSTDRGGAVHAVGDDRDLLLIDYGKHGPPPETIATGSGGDPFSESGWTGWFDLDTGFAVSAHSVTVGPCAQTGVLTLSLNGSRTEAPLTSCGTETSQATVPTPHLTSASRLSLSSNENRASAPGDLLGALVDLTVPLGEPGGVSKGGNSNVLFQPTGMPTCTANLRLQAVTCNGLVPGERYTLTRLRGHVRQRRTADFEGSIQVANLPGRHPIQGGDRLLLANRAGRRLTELHVAHLRVAINASETVLAGGRCQPGDYWGAPLSSLPSSPAVGVGGATDTGSVCPFDGSAAGLPDGTMAQTDDLSGGETLTSLPLLEGTAPTNDAIVSGAFTALAQTVIPGANGAAFSTAASVGLTIVSAATHERFFHAANAAAPGGVAVPALPAGVYKATWVVRDRNGDTRTVVTRFISQG
jgi:hypothetical protein